MSRAAATVFEDARTTSVAAVRDGRPVILRAPRPDFAAPEDLALLRHGARIARQLAGPWIVQVLGVEVVDARPVQVLEDTGARPLRGLLEGGELSIEAALGFAGRLARALGEIHRRGVVHHGVEPASLWVDPRTGDARLAGFERASRLSWGAPGRIEGALAYASPEQTGRMNRDVDHRADLYALGVTLYEMLAGKLPFAEAEPAALVHAHLAVAPEPLHLVQPTVSAAVSDVVMRLLAKSPEDRYQSADGLAADLEECLRQYKSSGTVAGFVPGERDVAATFQVPQRVHGRAREAAILVEAFERAAGGAVQVVVVEGGAGVGKSALVRELQRAVTERRGIFASGAVDPGEGAPHGVLARAFGDLVEQVLAEGPEPLAAIRDRLLCALGPYGQVVLDVIPALERLTGPQPPVPAVGPWQEAARFELALGKLLPIFATRERPLVLFLDDLHLADAASLRLIRLILRDAAGAHLLLVGAGRDGTLAGLRNGLTSALTELSLGPLDAAGVQRMILDALGCPPEEICELAALVIQRSGGDPFHVHQLLRALHEDGLLVFDAAQGHWRCELGRIAERSAEEIVAARLRGLPEATRRALALAACLGDTFDLGTLAALHAASERQTAADLGRALEAGLIAPVGDGHRLVPHPDDDEPSLEGRPVVYRFPQRRLREAAYALLADGAREQVELRAGRLILSRAPDRVFDVVGHLDRAGALVTDPTERLALAQLHLVAGARALGGVAFELARRYLDGGLALLPEDCWSSAYAPAFGLHRARAECGALLGDLEDARRRFEDLRARARTDLERAELHGLETALAAGGGRVDAALRSADAALRLAGFEVPDGDAALAAACAAGDARLQERLAGVDLSSLADAPALSDAAEGARARLLCRALLDTAPVGSARFQLLSTWLVAHALDHGVSPDGAIGLAAHGLALGARGQHDAGHRSGAVALAQCNWLGDRGASALVSLFFGGYLSPWRRPLRASFSLLDAAYTGCLEGGMVARAAEAALLGACLRLMSGEELDGLADRTRRQAELLGRLGQASIAARLAALEQGMRRLLKGDPARVDVALVASAAAAPGLPHDVREVERSFRAALHLAAILPGAPPGDQARHRAALAEAREALRRAAEGCAESFLHKELLAGAEAARADGRDQEAMDLYERAIATAAEHEIVQDEALACELAGRFHLARGRRKIARTYLVDARYAYLRWGAGAKVAQLDRAHAELLSGDVTAAGREGAGAASPELGGVVRAAQALSGELVLAELRCALVRAAIEGAGAQRGSVILTGEAEVSGRGDLAYSVVRYVERTRARVVLGDAAAAGQFRADPYVASARPRSILAAPILAGEALVGVLYLENNAEPNAFTAERCRAVELLAGQAAVSIGNARRYEALERRVDQRSGELDRSQEELGHAQRRLKATQQQLLRQEKLASLGSLTAGIAHEIKNPLNFVKNFAELSIGLADELSEGIARGDTGGLDEVLGDLRQNLEKIRDHGQRANGIINGMLLHARAASGTREEVDVNALLADSVNLAYHGMRGRRRGFDVGLHAEYDRTIGVMRLASSELGQVFVNVIDNACYAMAKKAEARGPDYAPALTVRTKNLGARAEVRIRDNGTGIPADVVERIFHPFFTTKPTGEGTGLGLSVSHDIVVEGHQGEMRVDSQPGEYTEFVITLPRRPAAAAG